MLSGQTSTRGRCPFHPLPAGNEHALWFDPFLVGTVRFMHFMTGGGLRQPVFKGFRKDKQPEECVVKEKEWAEGCLSACLDLGHVFPMFQIKGRCTYFLLLKSKLNSRNENKLGIFKITLPNINFEAFNHQDKVDGGVNIGLRWLDHGIVIKLADSRDADIIQAIGKDPSIKRKELVNINTRAS